MSSDNRDSPVTRLVQAAESAWEAFLAYGPVEDGRPEGIAFDASLDGLMKAVHEAKYSHESGYSPTIKILLRCVRTPGGRGRNARHWIGTIGGDMVRGPSEQLVLGELLSRYHASGEPPARVVICYADASQSTAARAREMPK